MPYCPKCGKEYQDWDYCPGCGVILVDKPPTLPQREKHAKPVRSKRDDYKIARFIGVGGGILALLLARGLTFIVPVSIVCLLVGIALLLWGSWSWAKLKGRNGWYALWGLLAPIGLVALVLLRDKWR